MVNLVEAEELFPNRTLGGMEASTDVTKLDVIRFSQWEDCRQISVSIILLSHDLSPPIRIGSLDQIQTERKRKTDEGSYSVGVGTLKFISYFHVLWHLTQL